MSQQRTNQIRQTLNNIKAVIQTRLQGARHPQPETVKPQPEHGKEATEKTPAADATRKQQALDQLQKGLGADKQYRAFLENTKIAENRASDPLQAPAAVVSKDNQSGGNVAARGRDLAAEQAAQRSAGRER